MIRNEITLGIDIDGVLTDFENFVLTNGFAHQERSHFRASNNRNVSIKNGAI